MFIIKAILAMVALVFPAGVLVARARRFFAAAVMAGLVVLLTACGDKSQSIAEEGAKSPPPPPSGYNATLPPIPFKGDACEYAKLVFIQAYQQYQQHLGDQALLDRQQQARLAAEAMCNADKEESKTWACAEGHSCR